jgi:hypothetical protein
MSAAVHRAIDTVLLRAITLLGNLVVLPFALAGRRRH